MKLLTKKIQLGLKAAACLGGSFGEKVLRLALKEDEFDASFFKSCVDSGFLERQSSDQYAFCHDEIQKAAYNLIPEDKRDSFRLLLGSRLLMKTPSSETGVILHCIVDNMNHGKDLIPTSDQRYELAEYNMKAGEQAVSKSAFHSASKYFTAGIALLGEDTWEKKYKLSMNLFDAASEVLYVTGESEKLSLLMETPLKNARSFDDKLNINYNLVRSLTGKNQLFHQQLLLLFATLSTVSL